MTRTSTTIKSLIVFSLLTGLVLVKGFAPFAPAESVSAAGGPSGATANGAATKAVGFKTGVAFGGHGGHNGGHDRPDVRPRPESPEVQEGVSDLREATARFHKLEVAIQEGYTPFGDCFSDPTEGGMGFHYSNAEYMEDPGVDPNHPELLLYEKQADGSMKFVAVEYLTFQAAWHKAGNRFLPRLFSENFHLNSTLLDEPFYLLHVWHIKHNPSGRFNDWNPRVACR